MGEHRQEDIVLGEKPISARVSQEDYEFLTNLERGKRALFLRDAISRAIQSFNDGQYPEGWDQPHDFLTDSDLAKKHTLSKGTLHSIRTGKLKFPSSGKYFEVIKNYVPGDKGWYPKED